MVFQMEEEAQYGRLQCLSLRCQLFYAYFLKRIETVTMTTVMDDVYSCCYCLACNARRREFHVLSCLSLSYLWGGEKLNAFIRERGENVFELINGKAHQDCRHCRSRIINQKSTILCC